MHMNNFHELYFEIMIFRTIRKNLVLKQRNSLIYCNHKISKPNVVLLSHDINRPEISDAKIESYFTFSYS